MHHLNWYWIALELSVAPVMGLLVSVPFWRAGAMIFGNLTGTAAILGWGFALILREYVEIDRAVQGCLADGVVCCPEPSAFTRLVRSPANTPIKFEITDRNLPLFFAGRKLKVTRAAILLRTDTPAPPSGLQLTVDGTDVGTIVSDQPEAGVRRIPGQHDDTLSCDSSHLTQA